MPSEAIQNSGMPVSTEAADDMAKYGITRNEVDEFHYREFRYMTLKDALEEAKRQQVADETSPTISSEAEEMAKYGITGVRVDHFLYGDFRYTNLEDAIAEAKRHPRAP